MSCTVLALLVSTLCRSSALRSPPTATSRSMSMAVEQGLLSRDRYVASNRFQTRNEASAAKFEARWANRKSRLATLDGFRYFTLLRQVPLEEVVGPRGAKAMGGNAPAYDYMSYTIWEDKDDFDAWRQGDAFVEAHGGKSIGSFLSAMISSLQILKGPPSPAMYDGLLHLSGGGGQSGNVVVENGWRVVEADGVNKLPAECFVAANRFTVREGAEAEFEERWKSRDSDLAELPGFKSFTMLRRDGSSSKKDPFGDDFNYMSFTVWKDKESFAGWRNSQSFKDAHSGGGGDPEKKKKEAPWVKPPTVAFWEGILELTSEHGP